MQKQSKHNLQKFDIIQLPLYMSDFETKPRPVLIENIVNNHIIYRPITDSYHKSQTGETIHLKSNQDATTSISRGGMIRISFKNKRFPTLFYWFLKFFMI